MNRQYSLRGSLRWTIAAAAFSIIARPAFAITDVIPHALAQYQHDSNVLMINDDPASVRTDSSGVPRREDNLLEYAGGVDVNYRWRDNRAYLTTDYQHYDYRYFSQLDHDGFAGTAGVDWVATHKVKGNLNYAYDRHQLSFIDATVLDPSLPTIPSFIETTQSARLAATYDMNSHWRGELGTSYSTAKLPDAGKQSYDTNETQAVIGAKYIGSARLTTGLSIDRRNGHYRDQPQNGYTTTLYQYSLDYKVGPRTTLNGTVGYTKRVQLNNSNSATIGSFTFNQQLTVKTGYFLQFKRTLDNYNTVQGSQLSTGGMAGINYQATQKITLSASYEQSKVHVTGPATLVGSNRDDKLNAANATLKYAALRWLTISPYYRYQRRDSENNVFDFKDDVYGINVEARFNP